ncbi:hypothetical protein CI088_13670 [Enterococcus plantarum]|uniref:Transposase n=1 Tax=Enterococcus plantarum TaxID=1077675 RepID=A0A2W4BFX7_9ENTE|nr:hypothetical protein [Enterococcus plantarum]PZL70929.1 hypothetical protein CI088_13670 [Enterococcus plantarum]
MKVNDNVLLKNSEPIKEVTYHDIYVVKDYLKQLASWKESLCLMKNFFDNQAIPLNKKIMREFHAQARVFNIFYANFVMSMDTLEKKVEKLVEKEKVRLDK